MDWQRYCQFKIMTKMLQRSIDMSLSCLGLLSYQQSCYLMRQARSRKVPHSACRDCHHGSIRIF